MLNWFKELRNSFNGERQVKSKNFSFKEYFLKFSRPSFSQSGEDLIIDGIFSVRGIIQPSFIDIGANHPLLLNNTAYFYFKGSRGINIEPNPDLITKFNAERPEDINLNIAIAGKTGKLPFYFMEDDTLSTFDQDLVKIFTDTGLKVKDVREMDIVRVHTVLENYFHGKFPDLLSIDVEGLELEILNDIDFADNFPKVICIESAEFSLKGTGSKRTDIMEFVKNKQYHLFADTHLNSIFVHETFI